MQFHCNTPGQTAVAEQNSQRAKALRDKPRPQSGGRDASPLMSPAHDATEQRFRRVLGISAGDGIAAKQKAVRRARRYEPMEHETIVAPREQNIAGLDVFERAAFNLHHITGPKGRQHAFPLDFTANEEATFAAQNLSHQSGTYRAPT
jgi:hypothetical protein